MKKVFILVVCVVMGVSAFAQKEEKKAIKQVFDTYVKSAKARQADEAIKCLSQSTIDYYSELLTMCKADSATLISRPSFDVVMTLAIKTRTDASVLCAMKSGEDLLRHALQEGMVSANKQSFGDAVINGDTAIVTDNNSAYQFVKENAAWKFDIYYSMSQLSTKFDSVIQEYKVTKPDFCVAMVVRMFGSGILQQNSKKVWNSVCE
ncbi:MAG: hypothetical protein II926_06715 [Bacteroidales bacterium]|nr:hypothetical protein [Bacteroidales bacterium]